MSLISSLPTQNTLSSMGWAIIELQHKPCKKTNSKLSDQTKRCCKSIKTRILRTRWDYSTMLFTFTYMIPFLRLTSLANFSIYTNWIIRTEICTLTTIAHPKSCLINLIERSCISVVQSAISFVQFKALSMPFVYQVVQAKEPRTGTPTNVHNPATTRLDDVFHFHSNHSNHNDQRYDDYNA